MVKSEMGVTGPEGLTPTVIGDVLKREGQTIGNLTSASGPIKVSPEGLAAMRETVDIADTNYKAAVGNILKDLESSMQRNQGFIDPNDYQKAITRLNKMAAPGQDFGKQQAAGEILEQLHGALESALSGEAKNALAQARYRYKIAKTLNEGRAVGNDGMVNPDTFGSRWDKRIGQTARGRDTLGQAADTFGMLGRNEATAGTTLQRVFAEAPERLKQGAVSGGLGQLGMAAAGKMLGL